jgi:hypothetical protein
MKKTPGGVWRGINRIRQSAGVAAAAGKVQHPWRHLKNAQARWHIAATRASPLASARQTCAARRAFRAPRLHCAEANANIAANAFPPAHRRRACAPQTYRRHSAWRVSSNSIVGGVALAAAGVTFARQRHRRQRINKRVAWQNHLGGMSAARRHQLSRRRYHNAGVAAARHGHAACAAYLLARKHESVARAWQRHKHLGKSRKMAARAAVYHQAVDRTAAGERRHRNGVAA